MPSRAASHKLTLPCLPPAGKWFVSTGKDNLLNAWRTPYGASIFQVPPTARLPRGLGMGTAPSRPYLMRVRDGFPRAKAWDTSVEHTPRLVASDP